MFPELKGHIKETIVQRWVPGNTYRPAASISTLCWPIARGPMIDIHFAGDYFAEIGNMKSRPAPRTKPPGAPGSGWQTRKRMPQLKVVGSSR